ncbi:MAG: HAMP domain-containing histidine kinase [Ruminococcus sp.]|nr:HAMP domain-containing histidine kinase [Ruminococcus sp.]
MRKITVTKPRFSKILLKRLLIGCIICSVICTAALITASVLYKKYIYDEGQDRAVARFDYILDTFEDYNKGLLTSIPDHDSFINFIGFYLTGEVEREANSGIDNKHYIACRLLDKDNNVIADHRQLLRLECIETTTSCYLCHPDVYDEVYAQVGKWNKMLNTDEYINSDREYGIFVYQAYIDGKYFYPRLSIRSMDKHEFTYGDAASWSAQSWTEEQALEFYPKDTSSMKYVEQKDKKMFLNFTAWEDVTDPSVESTLDEYIKGDMFKEGEYKNVYVFTYQIYPQEETDSTQPEYTLVCAFPYSFVRRYSLLVSFCALGAFAAALLIVFICAKISYANQKAQYQIFTARQQTTNAMAHDLKTPLTSIAGFAEMLQSGVNPEKHEHYLAMISKNVEQMNNIVSDILKLAKSESSADILSPEQLSAEDICNDIIKELKGTFETHKLSSNLNVVKNAVIKADKKLLTQALSNLLHNAAVYSESGSTVRVTITEKALCITNTPAQMPKLSADELVKPFVKDDTSRGENSGSGVGLSIAKQDLERMGFELKIEITDSEFRAGVKFK